MIQFSIVLKLTQIEGNSVNEFSVPGTLLSDSYPAISRRTKLLGSSGNRVGDFRGS
jgi:hypothetical protein